MSAKLGALVKEARSKAKLTQTALADMVEGLEQAQVGKIERGEFEPSQAVLKRMAKPLGLTQKALLEAASGSTAANKTASSGTAKKTSAAAAKKTTAAAKKTTAAAKKTTSSTAKKTSSAAKKTSSAKKTASTSELKLTATEKKLVQLYRKADSSTKKSVINILEGDAGLADVISTLISGKSDSALSSLFGSGKDAIPADAVGTLLENALGKLVKK